MRAARPTARPTPNRALAAALFLGLAACAATGRTGEVDRLLKEQRFGEAVRAAEANARRDPGDADAERAHRRASVAWYLEQARRATFEDREEEALQHLSRARAISPENPVVEDWIEKTHSELARLWLDRAFALEAEGELDAAEEAFREARSHEPTNDAAIAGEARMLIVRNYRRGLGEDYYQEGVRKLRDALLLQARQNFGYATKYLPEDGRAEDRREWVKRQLAGERIRVAQGFEEEGLFPAAHTEYRIALLLDPGNSQAEAGLERAEQETRALAKLEEADMLVRKGRLDDASVALAEGLAMTELQKDEFERKRIDIREKAFEKMYGRAYDLESDYLYEEAVAAYGDLLEETPYYEDAIARRDTLLEYIALAQELYAKAAAAETDEARLDYLLQIDLFWPEYRDVPQQLQRLDPTRELKGR